MNRFLACLGAAALALAAAGGSHAGSTSQAVVAAREPQSAGLRGLGRWRGHWEREGRDLPIEPRSDAIVVRLSPWSPAVLIWGGVGRDDRPLNDGVLLDDGAAMPLPSAPFPPRRDFTWAPAADLVIYGGVGSDGRWLSDGWWLSSDPVSGFVWKPLPQSPLPPGPVSMGGDLSDMLFIANDPTTGGARLWDLARISGAGGRWRDMGEVPLPIGDQYDLVVCCPEDPDAGEVAHATVFSERAGRPTFAARWERVPGIGVDPWTQLGSVPLAAGEGGPVQGLVTERWRTAWMRSSGAVDPGAVGAGIRVLLTDPVRRERPWRLTAPAPDGVPVDPGLVLTPRHIISLEGYVAWDMLRQRWLELPPRGWQHKRAIEGASAWWHDGRLWVYGGREEDGTMVGWVRTFVPRLPSRTIRLPTGPTQLTDVAYQGGVGDHGCRVYRGDGRWILHGDPSDPLRIWLQQGSRKLPTSWPEDWWGRFDPDLEIVATDGRVMAREGDICKRVTGSGG
jgi:hypothetical protein